MCLQGRNLFSGNTWAWSLGYPISSVNGQNAITWRTSNSGYAASQVGKPQAWRTCMVAPTCVDTSNWPTNNLTCWWVSPNTVSPNVHPQENGHTNCGTAREYHLPIKNDLQGHMSTWINGTQGMLSETSGARKGVHAVYFCFYESQQQAKLIYGD